MNLVLHPRTKQQLQSLGASLPQALLLTGPAGAGKRHLAEQWLRSQNITTITFIGPEEKTGVSVGQIRDLYHTTRSKRMQPHAFVIDPADSMSSGAQNAFLKLLEEPGSNIHFVLTASSHDNVLATIRSRAQEIEVSPVTSPQLQQHLAQFELDAATIQQILFVAQGRVGLATQLAQDPELLAEYRQQAAKAKLLLTGTAFERMQIIGEVAQERGAAMQLLNIASGMGTVLLERAAKPSEQQQLVKKLAAIHLTLERLLQNGNVKVQLTRLALEL